MNGFLATWMTFTKDEIRSRDLELFNINRACLFMGGIIRFENGVPPKDVEHAAGMVFGFASARRDHDDGVLDVSEEVERLVHDRVFVIERFANSAMLRATVHDPEGRELDSFWVEPFSARVLNGVLRDIRARMRR